MSTELAELLGTAHCLYCGVEFEKVRVHQSFCKNGHRNSYRRRKAQYAGQPHRCPHTFKLSFNTPEDAAAAPWAKSPEHGHYLCWCGKWHYGRRARYNPPAPDTLGGAK